MRPEARDSRHRGASNMPGICPEAPAAGRERGFGADIAAGAGARAANAVTAPVAPAWRLCYDIPACCRQGVHNRLREAGRPAQHFVRGLL